MLNPQELATTIYSYHKSPNASKSLLKDLMEEVFEALPHAKPIEICLIMRSYCEEGLIDDKFILLLEKEFFGKFEQMNAEDMSWYYYCFTKAGFKGSARFFKYLDNSLKKMIPMLDGQQVSRMFLNYEDE